MSSSLPVTVADCLAALRHACESGRFVARIVPGTIAFAPATITSDSGLLINSAVLGTAVSCVLLNLSHIMPRIREPEFERG